MPRVLARLPYGASTKPIEEFGYEEVRARRDGQGQAGAARPLHLDERRLRHGHAS